MSVVRITIEARANTGKTTIGMVIEKALKEAGFKDVTLIEEEMTERAKVGLREDIAQRAKKVAEKNPTIVIQTKQANRLDTVFQDNKETDQ